MNNTKKIIIGMILTAIIFGAGGYVSGSKKAGSTPREEFQRGTFTGGNMPSQGMRGVRSGRGGGGMTVGEVLAKDAQSLTVKLRDGGSRIVFYAPSTGVMRMASGTLEEVTLGAQVFVSGTQNADGSVTAESIQLRPEGSGQEGVSTR